MEDILKISSYIAKRYQKQFHKKIDEMKLHKLLYFSQRECIIETGKPLFVDAFQAWRYGPVMVCVRDVYTDIEHITTKDFGKIYPTVFDKIFIHYAVKSSISLSDLSHGEYSWQHAREGLEPFEPCEKNMLTEDIYIDAERIKKRRLYLKRLS